MQGVWFGLEGKVATFLGLGFPNVTATTSGIASAIVSTYTNHWHIGGVRWSLFSRPTQRISFLLLHLS